MTSTSHIPLPPGQQLAAADRWPIVGERAPRGDETPWKVDIAGATARPCTLALDELRSLDQTDAVIDIHCVTRWSKPGMRFRGVPLAALLARVQPAAEARFVSFVARSDRRHSTSLVLADALRLDTLIALDVDDDPLPIEHGGPVRVVVPGRYFYKSLKWLERIELLADDRLGFWESTAGYHNTADPQREQRYIAGALSKAEAREIFATRDVSRRELHGFRAAGLELAGFRASDALLRDADFCDCDLRGAVFDGANLSNARFQRARLSGANFERADLEGAAFDGADLRGARLSGASLLGASFCSEVDQAAGGGAIVDRGTQVDPAALADLTPRQRAYLRMALAQAEG